jgi:pimeloyl-ACP methyl ester carboxylesterase
MPLVERDDGARLHWEERGEGPGLLIAHSYIQHPAVLKGLFDELASDHRLIRYDARGTGQSSPGGPFDMNTDVEDMLAICEAAGPVAVVANGDATNRAVHAGARQSDAVPVVISLESLPLSAGDAVDTDALVASAGVLSALVGMMRADYRSGMMAAIQRGNPDMTPDELRERIDRTTAYSSHEAAVTRLEEWIGDAPADDAAALGDRLVIAYEGAGGWFPADLHEAGRKFLPEARFERLEGGPISRPDLTAAVVRGVTASARA